MFWLWREILLLQEILSFLFIGFISELSGGMGDSKGYRLSRYTDEGRV